MGVERNSRIGTGLLAALLVLIGGLGAPTAVAQQSKPTVEAGVNDVDAALERYVERQRRQVARQASVAGRGEEQARRAWRTDGRPGGAADACSPRSSFDLRNRPERPRFAFARGPVPNTDENAPIFACAFPSLTLQDTPAQTTQPSGAEGDVRSQPAKPKRAHEASLEEINNKLNNPGADLAQLNFKFTWNQYTGDMAGRPHPHALQLVGLARHPVRTLVRDLLGLKRHRPREGASSQNSLTMNFQPVLPFSLNDGGHFIVRPSIPVSWKPHYNASSRGFDEQFGLGDMQIVGFYSRTDMKKGYMWGAGATMQIPTHTDDVLGRDQFWLGPAAFAGAIGKWGSAGLFPQHWWNIGGSDEGYTCVTALQPWYWFSVGKGYQIGGSPIITYNWAADDSDEAWTVPVNLGVAKTVMMGSTPVKFKFEGIYYIEQPDSFGPHWGLQLTITPVIPNPFEGHVAQK